MKRDELTKLGLEAETIDKIMALHGQTVEGIKAQAATAKAEAQAAAAQLEEANKAIQGFKTLDIDGIKAAAEDYKTKWEQAQADAAAQVEKLKFDHALDAALTSARAKSAKAVKALLNLEGLKLTEDGLAGLDEQLGKVREEAAYLFETDEKTPKIVTGAASNTTTQADIITAAARKAAGLK